MAACQIAKAIGCKVIATASTDEKRKVCKEKAGVDEVVDYTKDGWQVGPVTRHPSPPHCRVHHFSRDLDDHNLMMKQKEVMRITGGKGVDVVFDPVGKLIPSLKCVNWGARLVVVGFASGPIEKVPANLLLLKSVSIVGLYWGATFSMSLHCPSFRITKTCSCSEGECEVQN